MSRKPMKGTVERLPSGRFRARKKAKRRGQYVALGTYPTEEEALAALDAPARPKVAVLTLSKHGEAYLERRAKTGVRDIATDRSRWACYVDADPLGKIGLRDLKRRDVLDWRDRLVGRDLAVSTVRNALNLLRCALEDALDRELVPVNVARSVKLHRSLEARADDTWTVLDPDEQVALLRSVDDEEWATVAAALGCGFRNTEQWRLRKQDVDLEARTVTVRYSRKGKPTKGGRVRTIHLFGIGLDAVRAAMKQSKGDHVFPAPRTKARRFDSSHPTRWEAWVERAGIQRHVRWYDLRHTCATSLLAGWWGRKWSLDEVRQMLGHTTIKITERYAHLLDDTLQRAAAGTVGFHVARGRERNQRATSRIRTGDLRFTNPRIDEGFSALAVAEFHARSTEARNAVSDALIEATKLAYDAARDPLVMGRVEELLRVSGVRLGLLDERAP